MSSIINEERYNPKNAIWFLLPAMLVVLVIFPIGIQTNLTSDNLNAHEADAPGPAMQLNDISSGFSRRDAARYFSIFPSMAISTLYVPYIWLRAEALPPYDLAEFAQKHLSLISGLIVLARGLNTLAALGIVILAFFIILMITGNLWASSFVSLSMALNPNLMFQASVTYYENFAIFWAFLSLFFYVKLWTGAKLSYLWILLFTVSSVLAVSTHDRMAGYYLLSFPALICRIWHLNRTASGGAKRTACLFLFSCIVGAITFCLANNVFGTGIKPVYDYIVYKYGGGCIIPGRMSSIWSLLRNQIGCHGHAVRLILCNLGGITPVIACLGAAALWRKLHHIGLGILLFPIGYQIVSVALPGWTTGRYVLGQTLFVALFSGFGVVWFLDNSPGLGKALIVSALIIQAAITAMVKISDIYFNPLRVVEKAVLGEKSSDAVKSVGVRDFTQSLETFDQFPQTWNKFPEVKFNYLTGDETVTDDYDLIVSRSRLPTHENYKLKREIFRKPPVWLIRLVREWCYLYSAGPDAINVQWRDRH